MIRNYILYHANCYDGFGSAFAFHMAHEQYLVGGLNSYHPMNYDDPLPEMEANSVVYMLDYSRKKEEILQLAKDRKIIIIDHHKTCYEELVLDPEIINNVNIEIFFDLNNSGCVLTWEYFFGSHPKPPILLQHIQDRDLWCFDLEDTKPVIAGLKLLPFDFYEWGKICDHVNPLIEKGKTVLESEKILIKTISKSCFEISIGGHRALMVNTPVLCSDVCNLVLEQNPEFDIAMYYFRANKNKYVFGLRGNGKIDVSAIAKKFNGGGHFSAAGFVMENYNGKFE